MVKNIAIGTVTVFVLWAGLEWVIHGILLKPLYMDTKQLWRPDSDVNMGLYFTVIFLVAAAFTAIYVKLVSPKNIRTALIYGAILGFGMGLSDSYIDYVFMPIPYELALCWFLAIWFEVTLAGAALGFGIQE
ncbi:MAG: hypothetical protein ACO3MW_07600 [Rhodospirillales bacterium]